MNNFKTKIKHNLTEAIAELIGKFIVLGEYDLDDKLLMAALEEVRMKMLKKMLSPQGKYSFTFSPAQALALALWFDDFITVNTTQVGNFLHQISNQVKQQYI